MLRGRRSAYARKVVNGDQGALMRNGSAVALVVLLALIIGAAAIQLLRMGGT